MDDEFDYGGPGQAPRNHYHTQPHPSQHQPAQRVPLQSSMSAGPTYHPPVYDNRPAAYPHSFQPTMPVMMSYPIPPQPHQPVPSHYSYPITHPSPSPPIRPMHSNPNPSPAYPPSSRHPPSTPSNPSHSTCTPNTVKVHLEPIFMNETQIAPENLDPPLLTSPLFSADASILLCPLLIDAIDSGLPKDAWEWESTEIIVPAAPKQELPRFTFMSKELLDQAEAHLKKSTTGRGYIALELYKTEMNYVRDLDIILNIYRKRLVDDQILEKISAKHIFDGVEDLYLLHLKILSRMDELFSINSWVESESRVGALFMQYNEDLTSSYSKFIDAYSLSMKEIKHAEKYNVEYCKVVTEMSKTKDTTKQGLKDLLITPVQRTTRYHMLLKDLLKKTPEGHPDRQDLTTALVTVKDLAREVNEKKRIEEQRTGIFDAFEQTKNCPPTFISASRRMVMSVDVVDSKNGKGYHLFLCNDSIMITSNVKTSGVLGNIIGRGADVDKPHKYVAMVPLNEMELEDVPEARDLLRIKFNTTGYRMKEMAPGSSLIVRFEGFDGARFKSDFCQGFKTELAALSQPLKSKGSSAESSANTSTTELHTSESTVPDSTFV